MTNFKLNFKLILKEDFDWFEYFRFRLVRLVSLTSVFCKLATGEKKKNRKKKTSNPFYYSVLPTFDSLSIDQGPVVQKPVSLTLGQRKIQSRFSKSLYSRLGNVSSEILSGSIEVFFSEVLK